MSNDEETRNIHPVREFIFSSRFAGLCGIIGPLIAISGIALAIFVSPWFNWFTNALSDLGHPWMLGGSNGTPGYNPAAPIFNSALTITGLITLVLTIWLIRYEQFERSTLGVIAAVLLTVSQFFLIGIGSFHEGYGELHFIVSLGFFCTSNNCWNAVWNTVNTRKRNSNLWNIRVYPSLHQHDSVGFVLSRFDSIYWCSYS